MTCVQYDLGAGAGICLDMLFEQARTQVSSMTRVDMRPVIAEGDSLAPPPSEEASLISDHGVS